MRSLQDRRVAARGTEWRKRGYESSAHEVIDGQRIRFARTRRGARRKARAMSIVARFNEPVICREHAALDRALSGGCPHIVLAGGGRFSLSLLANAVYPLIEVRDAVRLSLSLADAATVRLVVAARASVNLGLSDEARAEIDVRDAAALKVFAAQMSDLTIRAHGESKVRMCLTGESRGYCYCLDDSRSAMKVVDESQATVRGWGRARVGLTAQDEASAYVNVGGNTEVTITARTKDRTRESVRVECHGLALINVRHGEQRVSIAGQPARRPQGIAYRNEREALER